MQMHEQQHHNIDQSMDHSTGAVGGCGGTSTLPAASVLPQIGQEHMKTLLADSIINLCKSSLQFSSEISVEALVGVTLDKQNILLMNINKSISCDELALRKEQHQVATEPTKRRKKGASPTKRKSSMAPPNKTVPPPNQSLDMYHRPWDHGLLAHVPNVTIKSEPIDPKEGTIPHSELRAHLESGIGSMPRGSYQQPIANLFLNGVGGNQANNNQPQNMQFMNNNSNGNQGSSLNTRSALYQHLQQQQQQRNQQQQIQQQNEKPFSKESQHQQNQRLMEEHKKFIQEAMKQQQLQQQQQHQSADSQQQLPKLKTQRSQSLTSQRSLSIDTSMYNNQPIQRENQSAQSSLSSSPVSSQAATPGPQSSPDSSSFCTTPLQLSSPQNVTRNMAAAGYINNKNPVSTENAAATVSSAACKSHLMSPNSSLMQQLQVTVPAAFYTSGGQIQSTVQTSTPQSALQTATAQNTQFCTIQPVSEQAASVVNQSLTADTETAYQFSSALQPTDSRVSQSDVPVTICETASQASGLEAAPGVLSVQQLEEPSEKTVLGLDADDDSDQDDFSPGKPKRRKSLLNGDVFLGYVHPKPEAEKKTNGHLDRVDTSAYINWKGTSGEEGCGDPQIQVKQELPDWTESYGSDDNNEEDGYDQEEESGSVGHDAASGDDEGTVSGELTNHSTSSNFVNEMLEQMEVSPDGEKKCPICSRVLKAKSDMGRHIRTHTKEKPHKCEECGRGFLQSYDLKRHRMQHSGRKPFQCCVCSKGFTRPDYLRNHQQVWHPELYKDC